MEWDLFAKRLFEPIERRDIARIAQQFLDLIECPEFVDEPVACRHAFDLMEKHCPQAAAMVIATFGRQSILATEYEYLAAAGC